MRIGIFSALVPEDITIHRHDYAATDADALREFPRHALAGKQFPDRLIAERISGD
jgi:hypothetical protein